MTDMINIAGDGKAPILIDPKTVNALQTYKTSTQQGQKTILRIVRDRHDDCLHLDVDETGVDPEKISDMLSAVGHPIIRVDHSSGLGDNREHHVTYISVDAISYMQSEANTHFEDTVNVSIGVRGMGSTGFLGVAPDVYQELQKTFAAVKGKDMRSFAPDEAMITIDVGSPLLIDSSQIGWVSAEESNVNVFFYGVGRLNIKNKQYKDAYEASGVAKGKLFGGEVLDEFNRQSLLDQMKRDSFDAAQSLLDLARNISSQIDRMIEIPLAKPDINKNNHLFAYPRGFFIIPEHIKSIECYEDLNPGHQDCDYYIARVEFAEKVRSMVDNVDLCYPTAMDRDAGLLSIQRQPTSSVPGVKARSAKR